LVPRACSVSGGGEVVVDARRRQDAGGCRAVLTGVEVARHGDRLGGRLDVGVVEDHHGRLAAELEVHPLQVPRRASATCMPRVPSR
jgi:hypothetical protein